MDTGVIEQYSYYERAFKGKCGMYNGQLNQLFTVIQKLDKIFNMQCYQLLI